MKALEWQRFLTEQRELHGKTVFSVAELANVARSTPHTINTELGRLRACGIIARYAQGRYGLAQGVEPEQVVASLDAGAYITGFYALFRQSLVTQKPFEITCFTNQRHNRRCSRAENPWKLRFITVSSPIYFRPAVGGIALPEQALCDFAYLSLADDVDPRHLVTFINLRRWKRGRLQKCLQRYPAPVRSAVEGILAA